MRPPSTEEIARFEANGLDREGSTELGAAPYCAGPLKGRTSA